MLVSAVTGLLCVAAVFGLSGLTSASGAGAAEEIFGKISWYGHDTFRIDVGKIVYADPYQIRHSDVADIILVSHDHHDHCSPDDIKKLSGPNTVVVAAKQCSGKLGGLEGEVVYVEPGGTTMIDGIQVSAVPAYNVNKSFHPKEKNGVGFVVTARGVRIYFAGDTDRIPEMKELSVDIALLPVSGTYVMTASEAAEAAADIKPAYVIPMHYGSIVGSEADASRFEELVRSKLGDSVKVKILEVGAGSP